VFSFFRNVPPPHHHHHPSTSSMTEAGASGAFHARRLVDDSYWYSSYP
jgi:hypothetical protein